jgi:uncharacterized protein DUF3617
MGKYYTMTKYGIAGALFFVLSGPLLAQGLEPGEWEFNAVTTSPLVTGAQNNVFKRCIRKEDADNPERWMARQSEAGPCQLKPLERTADSMKWEVSCPKTNSRGNGVARLNGPGSVESELQMTTELQGYRIQTNTRTTGKRLGPCKS